MSGSSEFDASRALPGYNVRILEGRYEGHAALRREGARLALGEVVVAVRDDELDPFAAETAYRGLLRLGADVRDIYPRLCAQLRRRLRDALRVVAARTGYDAALERLA